MGLHNCELHLPCEPNLKENAAPSPCPPHEPNRLLTLPSIEEERDSLATVRGFKARRIIRRSLSPGGGEGIRVRTAVKRKMTFRNSVRG